MISVSSALFCFGLAILLMVTALFGPNGSRRCAVTLAANWLACMTYVLVSGNYTPWGWFWTMDFLSATALTIHPVSKWSRWLAYSYMLQFGFHAAFGLAPIFRAYDFLKSVSVAGGDPLQYLHRLDMTLMAQMALVFIWTGGNGLLRICRAHHWRTLWLDRFLGEAPR